MSSLSQPELQDAWKSAVKECEAKFSPEDLDDIKKSTGPDEVLDFIKAVQAKERDSKLSRVMSQIRQFGRSFKAFERGLDLIAQGTPQPGCMIWGSIRFVLAVCGVPFSLLRLERNNIQQSRTKFRRIYPGSKEMYRHLRTTTRSLSGHGGTS